MKLSRNRGPRSGSKDGQILILFLLFAVVLLLFVGLGIDLGFAYITKAQLSKALDASSLAAVSNYSSADRGAAANTIAINTFWANYATNGISGLSGNVQIRPSGNFTVDAANNLTYTNSASARINTFFIGLLPQWKTLTVGDTAVANRAPVVMTLVLDRTGSMAPNARVGACQTGTQGGKYLPGAVTQFINIFDETLDRAALVTFSDWAVNNVPMTAKGSPFKNNIINTVDTMNWGGSTCSICGLLNAQAIQNGAGAPANAIKVVVFFTDGRANITQYKFPTSPPGGAILSFGGADPQQAGCTGAPNPGVNFFLTNGNSSCSFVDCGNSFTCNLGGGKTITPTTTWTNAMGVPELFCAFQVTQDATNRLVLTANQLRASSNYVYAVGLSAPGAIAAPTLTTLQQMANDPDGPTFDPTQPVGAAFLSSGQDLSEVFQQVAADIILRLVR